MTSGLKTPLLSFIIPMYNCGEYISRCIDSLLGQGLEDNEYEIIVVNDGSTDNGHDIVAKYAQQHPNITLIDQNNQGVGAARNTGMEYATGEYIAFVDADDMYASGATVGIFSRLDSIPDIIAFEHIETGLNNIPQPQTLSFKQVFNKDMKSYVTRHSFYGSCCTFFFKKYFIKDIRFGEQKVGEDAVFMMRVFDKTSGKVIKFDTKLYVYCKRTDSAMTRAYKAFVKEVIDGYIEISKLIKSKQLLRNYDTQEVAHITNVIINYCSFLRILSTRFSLKELNMILKKCRETGLFPLPDNSNWLYRCFSFLSQHSFLTWCAAPLYRNIYYPYFKRKA